MLALYRSGRQADALAEYAEIRRLLTTDLGLEPSDELRALQRQILEHAPTLGAPARVNGSAVADDGGADRPWSRSPPQRFSQPGLPPQGSCWFPARASRSSCLRTRSR